jgi:hypothetical protein
LSFFGVLCGDALNVGAPADGSVTSAKLAGGLSVGLTGGSASTPSLFFTGDANTGLFSPTADTIAFAEGGSEAMRIDSSGRLLVGTSTSLHQDAKLQTAGTGYFGYNHFQFSNDEFAPTVSVKKSRSATVGTNTIVQNNDRIGTFSFFGADGSTFIPGAEITAFVDGTPGANDMPGRLVFFTTADGASSPTERMRVTNGGHFLVAKATPLDPSIAGFETRGAGNTPGLTTITVDNDWCLMVNRLTSDGDLVLFRQANVTEGIISVSGSTVTYGGGHLARWSQLPDEEDPTGLLKGTVMSNLDEMCEWGEEDNEQLNKTKVSDVEGDLNVAGVFVSMSSDETGPLDFFVGMTGDMIIRIAEGVTVQRGDLLMSAGDGTATPQGDGFVQDKTIAKVTSTHVTCTYDDGSYCVPCVLMAC